MRLASRLSASSFLWTALFAIAALTVALNASQIGDIVRILGSARPEYVIALFICQGVFTLNMGLFYASTFRVSGLHADVHRFTVLAAASHFVNLISKTSGLGGLALYLREGSRHGEPAARTTAAYMAAYAMGYAAFLTLLALSLAVLYAQGALTRIEVAGSAVLLTVVLTVSAVLLRGLRDEASLQRLLFTVLRPLDALTSRLLHRVLISPAQVRQVASEVFESATALRTRPARFAVPFGHAVAVEVLSALALFLVALALGVPLSFDLALAGYALSLLFTILSITPAGLGFVEASLVVFLTSTGIPAHQAVAVTVAFRLFDFWLPVAIGGLSFLVLRSVGSTDP